MRARKKSLILLPCILPIIASAIILIININTGLDESEHLHCSWLISKGLVPYVDFWQHHFPITWLVLAPLVKLLRPGFTIYAVSRVICAILFALTSLIGWKISQMVWKGKANLAVYILLIFAGGITWEFFWMRPDLFMLLFLLIGLYAILKMSEGKAPFSLLAGIMISLALSFSNKQFLFTLLPFAVIFLGRKKSILPKLALYIAGLLAGFLPLAIYLFKNKIINEFFTSVVHFNSRHLFLCGKFPLILSIIGVIGWFLLRKEYRKKRDPKQLVLLSAFILVSAGSLFKMYGVKYFYYLNLWLVLCAALASGCDINGLLRMPRYKKSVKLSTLSFFLALVMVSVIAPLKRHSFTFWGRDRIINHRLTEICKNETCLTIIPYHPISAYDAIRVYSLWQYIYIGLQDKWVTEDALGEDIVKKIIELRPAVISGDIRNRPIFDSFLGHGLISEDGYEEINDFISRQYTLETMYKVPFYIRNDKVAGYEWPDELQKKGFDKLKDVLR